MAGCEIDPRSDTYSLGCVLYYLATGVPPFSGNTREAILRAHHSEPAPVILDYVTEFLQSAHHADERYTVRDGINIARYALKRLHSDAENEKLATALRTAVVVTLGEEALRHLPEIDG